MKKLILTCMLAVALLVAFGALVYAQTGGGFDISWSSVDGGGTTSSTGGGYSLGATIGQPDAGQMSTGAYTLSGGFWQAAAPTATATPTSTPVSALLVGHVNWQGRPAQPNAGQQLPVTLTLKSANGEINYPVQTTDANGFFTASVAGLVNGPYLWRVKGPKYLANSGTVNLTGAPTTGMEIGLMKVGDANNDNIISVQDFNIVRVTFGKGSGDPGYDARGDFNGDNLVTVGDFNLLRSNFGFSGTPPLGPAAP